MVASILSNPFELKQFYDEMFGTKEEGGGLKDREGKGKKPKRR